MKKIKKEHGRKFNIWILVISVLVIIAAAGIIYFAFFNGVQGDFGEKIIKWIEAGSNNIETGDNNGITNTGGSSSVGSGVGSGGSGGGSGAGGAGAGVSGAGTGSSSGGSSNSTSGDLLCLLARPGNLPE